ncbi:MAG: hypothetical protein Q9181_004580 [Wetmoreana brouardii]
MSQGPPASRPTSTHQQDDRYKTLPPLESRTLPPINDSSRARVTNGGETISLSARVTPAQSPVDQKNTRSLGMHNILNPASKESPEGQIRRRKAEQYELPSPATTAASRAPSTSMTPSPGSVSLPSITPQSMNVYLPPVAQGPSHIMIPRSASEYAPNSIAKPVPGTIDAKATPFIRPVDQLNTGVPEGNHHTELPSVHPPAALPFGNSLPPPRSPPGRRPSSGSQLVGALDRRASLAGSDSPSTTYSSYSQFSRTPPATQTVAAVNQTSAAFFGVPYPGPGTVPPVAHGFGSSGPVSSATAQIPYQIMTLDTDQGPIQVPVDVQAASKVADEKRKRNATASHRFRQRRKEKERETTHNIQKLQNQISEIEKERDYYRQERDFFRSVLCRNPSQAHLAARPPSPRHMRAVSQPGANEGPPSGQWHPPSDDGNQIGRNTRRRTSSYVPAQDVPQSMNSVVAPQQQQQQQQPPPPPRGYPQLQPANFRGEDTHPRVPGHHAAAWHPSHR